MHFSSNGFAAVDLAGSSTTYFRSLLYSISGYIWSKSQLTLTANRLWGIGWLGCNIIRSTI